MEFVNYILQYIKLATVADAIDILIVAYLLYKIYQFIRGTSVERLLKGIVVLLLALQIADLFGLNVIYFVLKNTVQLGLIALIILFQPELRHMLEQVGKSRISNIIDKNADTNEKEFAIIQIVEACSAMSWSRTGALIVIEKGAKLNDIIKTGTVLNAEISAELIKNIFYPKAPLHDGAVIIRDNKVVAAGCVLPLSSNPMISRELGTRHRAAVGVSEHNDVICVVVSEETGSVSVAIDGTLKRHLAPETLEKLLLNELVPDKDENKKRSFFAFWKGKAN